MVDFRMVGKVSLAKSEPIKVRGKDFYYGNDNIVLDFKIGSYDNYGYIWLWVIGVNGENYYGRTIEDLYSMLNMIKDAAHPKTTYVIWVRDLSAFYHFMKNYFVFDKVFARDRNDVLNCWGDIFEFRNFKEITSKEDRIERDDYSKIYSPTTPLTVEELKEFGSAATAMWEWIKENRTGDLFTLEHFNYSFAHCCERRFLKTMELNWAFSRKIFSLIPSLDVYNLLMGDNKSGFIWQNLYYLNMKKENVYSYDISSCYPGIMVRKKFPMTAFIKEENPSLYYIKEMLMGDKMAFIGTFYLKDLKKRSGYTWLTTKSNTVAQADEWTRLILNDVEFRDILKNYKFSEIIVKDLYTSRYGYLPKEIRETIIDLYKNKTELKGVNEKDYKAAKVLLNNIFGRSLQPAFYDEEARTDSNGEIYNYNIYFSEKEKEQKIYNKYSKKIMLPQWGIWTAAYGRHELLEICNKISIMSVVYCDTDSVKFLDDRNKVVFEEANKKVVEELKEAGMNGAAIDKYGNTHIIGTWEFEGKYENFKAINQKQYFYSEGENFDIRLAGALTENVKNYFHTIAAKERPNVFSSDMTIPKEYKPFISRQYIDLGEEKEFEIIDYLGLSHVESLRYMVKEEYKGYSAEEVMFKLTNGIYKFN